MKSGTLYTCSFYKVNNSKGLKISITNNNPLWLSPSEYDIWLTELAPSQDILDDYNNSIIDFDTFETLYKKEIIKNDIENNIPIKAICNILEKGNDVTILSNEKRFKHTSRQVIGRLFNDIGYVVKELK